MSKYDNDVIILASCTNKCVSKIVHTLKSGVGVVTPRPDV